MKIIVIAINLVISIIFLLMPIMSNDPDFRATRDYLLMPLLFVVLIYIMIRQMIRYLKPSEVTDEVYHYKNLIDIIVDIKRKLFTKKQEHITDDDKIQILNDIKYKFTADMSDKIFREFEKSLLEKIYTDSSNDIFNSNIRRLNNEIIDLKKRGTLNLIVGITITMIGIIILGLTAYTAPHTTSEFISFFVPRLSLSIIVEFFAYFFLRLYKISNAEIKYFQNEITNIEIRQIALIVARNDDKDKSSHKKIAMELSKIERNFILTKGQTTVELERERIYNESELKMIEPFKEVMISLLKKSKE